MMLSLNKINELIGFERDSNTLLVGPTSSGKTTLLKRILDEGLFLGKRDRVFVLVPEETRDNWVSDKVEIISGLEAIDNFLANSSKVPENSVVIFDDLMQLFDQTSRRIAMEKWFSVTTHHRHLWTFFVTHDMFHKNMTAVRRNTQNFILFDLLQNDHRASLDFVNRLLGISAGTAFTQLWKFAVEDPEKGWIRLDQKISRGAPVKTIISAGGVTPQTAWLALRSSSKSGPFYLDAVSNPSLESTKSEIPDKLISHGSYKVSQDTPGRLPAIGTSDVQQPDGQI